MDILGKLLGSTARVKIMRLFLSNKDKVFTSKEISLRSRVNTALLRKELKLLQTVGFLKNGAKGWYFNTSFKYTNEFEGLLLTTDILDEGFIASEFRKAGKIRLLVVSGIFIKDKDSRVDLLIVGDKLKKGKIDEVIKKMEAEVGAELSYATFETAEFVYRLKMYDKLVRDILDFPHQIIIQSKEFSTYTLKSP